MPDHPWGGFNDLRVATAAWDQPPLARHAAVKINLLRLVDDSSIILYQITCTQDLSNQDLGVEIVK
jgi:hypothetical protein